MLMHRKKSVICNPEVVATIDLFWQLLSHCSEYPEKRSENDGDGVAKGVAGTLNLLQNVTLSTQPIASLDWSPDKQGLCVCASFDQSVRVLIVTKLNRMWACVTGLQALMLSFLSKPNVNLLLYANQPDYSNFI